MVEHIGSKELCQLFMFGGWLLPISRCAPIFFPAHLIQLSRHGLGRYVLVAPKHGADPRLTSGGLHGGNDLECNLISQELSLITTLGRFTGSKGLFVPHTRT